MSYDEVERGLPPVNEVWRNPRNIRPDLFQISPVTPNWTILTPDVPNSQQIYPSSKPNKRPSTPPLSSTNESNSSDDNEKTPTPVKPKPTQRFIIQDSDDDDMKVIKLDPLASVPSTLDYDRQKKDERKLKLKLKPNLIRQNNSTSLSVPIVRITASSVSTLSPSPSTTAITRRAKHFIIFLLTLLPPLFFTVTVHYVKFIMVDYGVQTMGLCIIQGLTWPSLIFLIFNKIWFKLELGSVIRKEWLELLGISVLTSGALLLQIVSIINLDVTVSLGLTFAPLVIATFIHNMSHERTLSLELLFTSCMVYFGVTLIGISCLTNQFEGNQHQFIIGLGASVGSMLLTIPSCLLLLRLRRKKIDDSITMSFCGIIGSFISLGIGLSIGFSQTHLDPGIISSVVTFAFFGSIFQFIESKLNPSFQISRDTTESINSEEWGITRGQRSILRLSRTRLGVFMFSGIWELLRHSFIQGQIIFPSVFSIFGIILLIIGYLMSIGYTAWLTDMNRLTEKEAVYFRRNRFLFIPWLFSKKS